MPKYLDDILNQPRELLRSLKYTLGPGRAVLLKTAAIVKNAKEIVLTGIGSSWHAGIAIQSVFAMAGRPVHLVDASELLHFGTFPAGAVMIAMSRTGQSVEVVKLLDKAKAASVDVIAITNAPNSALAKQAAVVLPMEAAFDHNVSVTMYSAMLLVGGLLAAASTGKLDGPLENGLAQMIEAAGNKIPSWQASVEKSAWFDIKLPTYFLARGPSLATCYEARLLWEEAAKAPATAMTTGGFRHGPQEMIVAGARIGLWIDQKIMRDQDLALAADLESRGVKVMLIGQDLSQSAADLVLSLPSAPPGCQGAQFLVDVIPAQLAAWREATLRGSDPDNFLLCPYVITTERGL